MVSILYTFFIYIYSFFIHVAALFNPKARKFVKGRKDGWKKLQKEMASSYNIIWFHAASLGEFEQGKPIIEKCRKYFPQYKVLVTFFSPSGYELRKNTPYADYVFYLPLDTPSNMKKWLKIVQPKMIILIKYEFWYHLIRQAKRNKIPVIVVSAVFRPDQFFFKPYGKWMLNYLKHIRHFFVQDADSLQILKKYHIHQVTVSGDTRFDRVSQLKKDIRPLPFIEEFKKNTFTLVAGSTWAKGEEYLTRYINHTRLSLKYIIVPHEINYKRIKNLQRNIHKNTLLYSDRKNKKIGDYEVLIIDSVGFLTSIYPYGDLAYVGGAYESAGIHNILEPAAFGLPVFYGPYFHKNREAQELVKAKGAKVAYDFNSFKNCIDSFYKEIKLLEAYGKSAQNFIQTHTGATEKVISYLRSELK